MCFYNLEGHWNSLIYVDINPLPLNTPPPAQKNGIVLILLLIFFSFLAMDNPFSESLFAYIQRHKCLTSSRKHPRFVCFEEYISAQPHKD